MENQGSCSSHVTNKVECQADCNKIINTGHNCEIVQADDVCMSGTYVTKKPLSPTTLNKKPIRFRKLPGVINKVTSRGNHNTIIITGHKGKIVQAVNVYIPVKYVIKKKYLHTARFNTKRQIMHRKSLGHVENKVISHGNHNRSISTGNNSTVVVANNMYNITLIVERPLSRAERLNNPKQSMCRLLTDRLNQLSANGKLEECRKKIDGLFRFMKDPDFCAVLWAATAINCINGGDMESAREAVRNLESLLDQTENSIEHELGQDHCMSLIYMREDRYEKGKRRTKRALCKTEHLQAGCQAAWVLINDSWLDTNMAKQEQDPHKQRKVVNDATASFRRAIEYSEREFPGQLQDNKSRIRQFALIGQVYLLLRCWRSVEVGCTKPENTDKITEEDVAKAQQMLLSLEKGESLCAICKVLYHLAKAHLCYRLKKYQECLMEAKKARGLAKKGSFKQYHGFANSIVKHFERQVA